MIALQPNRAGWLLLFRRTAPRRAGHLDIFVDHFAVVDQLDHFGIGDLFAAGIETGRAKRNVEPLPLTRRFAGVRQRGVALHILITDPARVDAATFDSRIFVLLDAETVIDLNFVAAHEIHARVGVFRNAKLDVDLRVTELGLGDQINGASRRSVDHDSLAGLDDEFFWVRRVHRNAGRDRPIAGRLAPTGEVSPVE